MALRSNARYVAGLEFEQSFGEKLENLVIEGVLAGGSTGLNVVAALAIAKELGPEKRVVTLGCDNGIKYLGWHIYS